MDTRRPFYEPPLRRFLGLPRHNTANDGARALAVGAAVVVACCTCLVLYLRLDGTAKRGSVVSFALLILPARLCAFAFACTFTGLALNQYAWYTTRTYHDCFHDEQGPVWRIVTFVVAIVSPSSWLLAVLLLLAVAAGLPRVMALGSLFDGHDKAIKKGET